jgi:hypothetical protein
LGAILSQRLYTRHAGKIHFLDYLIFRLIQLPPAREAIVPDTLRSERHKLLISLLVEAREKANLTQAEVAVRLGRHQSFIANIETHLRRVDVVELLDLADAIGFDPDAMIAKLKKAKPGHRRRSRDR